MARTKSEMIKGVAPKLPGSEHNADNAEKKAPRKLRRKGRARKLKFEIQRLQKTGKSLMSHAAIERIIREIVREQVPSGVRLTSEAIANLHGAAEAHINDIIKDAYKITTRVAGRTTIMREEFRLVASIYRRNTERFASVRQE